MSDTVTLNEEIRLRGAKEATAGLDAFARAASRVAEKLGMIGSLAGALTGLGGAFALVESVRGIDDMYKAVSRVKTMTGMTASNTHAMFKMFKLSGVEMEGAERIMVSMARLSGKLGDGVAESAEQAAHLKQIMTRLHIDPKANPLERMMQMSKAVQDKKLGVNDLASAFTIPRSQLDKYFSMLAQGPEKLREIQKKTLGSASLIDEAALQSYARMLQSRRELKESWDDLVGTLYKGLVPAITTLLKSVQHGFEAIEPTVRRIGKFLEGHSDSMIRMVKSLLAIRTGLSVFNLFRAGGAEKLGMGGAFRKASGFLAGRAAVHTGADYFAARSMSPGIGMFQSSGGIMSKIFGSSLGRIGLIGAAVMVALKVFEMIKSNAYGIRDTFKDLFGHLEEIFNHLRPVFSALWSIVSAIGDAVGSVLVVALRELVKVIDWIAEKIAYLTNLASGKGGESTGDQFWRGLMGPGVQMAHQYEKIYGPARDRMMAEKKTKDTEDKEHKGTTMDFRGSKFEITQNFAEGFDPNRVAVTFQSELIKSGEKRIDSNLRPLYSYR